MNLRNPFTKVTASPKIIQTLNEPCPNCGLDRVFMIEAKLQAKKESDIMLLKGGDNGLINVKAVYAGCPACGWQSPAMMTEDHIPIRAEDKNDLPSMQSTDENN